MDDLFVSRMQLKNFGRCAESAWLWQLFIGKTISSQCRKMIGGVEETCKTIKNSALH